VFCIACGTRLPDEAAYCSACGRVTHQPAAAETPTAAPTEGSPQPATLASAPNMAGTARTWSEAGGIPYLWNGRWWSRGPSGEVVVWDATHDNWDLALSTQTPFFMRRPRFASLRTPAIWTCELLGFFALFTMLAVAADVEQAYLAGQVRDGEAVSPDDLEDSNTLFEAMKGLQVFAVLGIAPLFIWWMQRAVRNLPALGAHGQKYSPGWAVGWWFIPFANFVQPARVMLEAWKGSGVRQVLEPDESWRSKSSDPLVIVWWLGCVAGWLSSNFIVSQVDPLDLDDPDRMGWAIAAACIDAALVVLAGLTVLLVRRLTSLQDRANRQFDVPSGSAATAPSTATVAAQPSW
jgi:hypothetical protein